MVAAAAEGEPSGGGEVGDEAEREDVTGLGDLLPPDVLGCHVGRRSGAHTRGGDGGDVHGAGDAEVDDLGSVGGEDDVGRFQVAVDHSGGVDGLQRLGDPRRQHEDLVGGQRPPFTDSLLEGRPGGVGRGEPGFPGVQVRRDDGHGVEPLNTPGRRDLQREPLAEFRVRGVRTVNDLDGHGTSGGRAPQVHAAHAALTQQPLQPVRTYLRRYATGRVCPTRHPASTSVDAVQRIMTLQTSARRRPATVGAREPGPDHFTPQLMGTEVDFGSRRRDSAPGSEWLWGLPCLSPRPDVWATRATKPFLYVVIRAAVIAGDAHRLITAAQKRHRDGAVGVERLDRMPPPRGRWHPTGWALEPATCSGSAVRRR